ncbi:MAG: S8 family serine peptidase [Gemmatimonadota bacterium]|nr:S8 family serine peptidase [Gemmatimonadota bacterium]
MEGYQRLAIPEPEMRYDTRRHQRSKMVVGLMILTLTAACDLGQPLEPVDDHAGSGPTVVEQTPRSQMALDRIVSDTRDSTVSSGLMFVNLKEQEAVRGVSTDGLKLPVEARLDAGSEVRAAFPGLEVVKPVAGPITTYLDGQEQVDTIYRTYLTVTAPRDTVFLRQLLDHPNVSYLEPNYTVGGPHEAVVPHTADSTVRAVDDARVNPTQWSSWGIEATRADLAWDIGYTGDGANVGMMDTGADLFGTNHPDLIDHSVLFANPTLEYADQPCGNPVTEHWCYEGRYNAPAHHYHGTGVLGTVLATNNSVGSVGIAPFASGSSPTIIFKVTYDPISPQDHQALDVAGMRDAVSFITEYWDNYSVDVRVAVTGVGPSGTSIDDTLSYQGLHDEFKSAALDDNVLWFSAAGNDDTGAHGPVKLPGAFPEVVAVGSVDSSLDLSWFSRTGDQLELVGPGESIRVSWNREDDRSGSQEYTSVEDGTSFAAPGAVGVARLALEKFPGWSASDLRDELQEHARDLGPGGRDDSYGHGFVDAYCVLSQHDPCEPLSVYVTGENNIQTAGYYTYQAFPSGGSGSYSYSWTECDPSCSTVGSSDSYARWVGESDPHFDISVTVNGSDPDAVADTVVVFNNIGGGPEAPERRGGGG